MTNGLGTGLFAVTLLGLLAGLALLTVLAAIAVALFARRTGRVPPSLRYLLAAICVGVLGVAGFGILVLFDEAPAAAALFASLAAVPVILAAVYFERTTGGTRLDAVGTTAMAWGGSFFLGVVVALGANTWINAAFDLAPAESRQLGVVWIATAVAGITVVLGTVLVGTRIGGWLRSGTGPAAAARRPE